MRLQTVKDIDVLVARLQAMRGKLAGSPDVMDEVRVLVHGCATMTGIWLDDLACRFADTGHSADDLFTAAWELVESLQIQPSGFESRTDPAFFAVLRDATASMLARLWINGYLLGPVPTDAWANTDLARTLLEALEHHADDRALTDDLDATGRPHPHGPAQADETGLACD
ncbi:hypothetical protein [Streptomyces collinus]|uniref:hypothetical protein n=1 Tax=Streptomyces collinus TaxID=42684 RepID=UPI0036A68040